MILDVSSNNGNVVWAKVLTNVPAPLGAMLKANEGVGCMDSKFVYNATQCHLLSIPFGAYHFATLNDSNVVKDATAEANYLLSSLNEVPETTLPLALDIETNKENLPPDQVVLWAKTFFKVLQEAGKTNLALYSGLAFLVGEHFDIKDFPGVKLWLAEYNSQSAPTLPPHFPDYWMWQYTDSGRINGIVGPVDLSKPNPLHLDT